MTNIETAKIGDFQEIIDLLNLTFSMAHCPHDFKKLQPKAYLHGEADPVVHYIVREKEKIQAVIGVYPETLAVGTETLKVGIIGSVAVHPDSQGKGYMQKLVEAAMTDCQRQFDFTALAGQRQRYEYFGFHPMGIRIVYNINQANVRHGLAAVKADDIQFVEITEDTSDWLFITRELYRRRLVYVHRSAERFLDITHTGNKNLYAVFQGDVMIGYMTNALLELALIDEDALPMVIKAWFQFSHAESVEIPVSMHEHERQKGLEAFCERSRVEGDKLYKIHNYPHTLQVLLRLKNYVYPLAQGRAVVAMEGRQEAWALEVREANTSVTAVKERPEQIYSEDEFYRLFLSPVGTFCPLPGLLKQWFPLAIDIPYADSF